MWKPSDSKIPQPVKGESQQPRTPSTPAAEPNSTRPVPAAMPYEHSMLGKSMLIRGEISGSEPIYIGGCVEGSISSTAHRVTIGREGKVKANISAREVVVMGNVCGNLQVGERVDIRSDASLTGDVVAQRISIEDGALFKGAIDVRKASAKAKAEAHDEPRVALQPAEPQTAPEPDLDRWAPTSLVASNQN